jgi:malonate decarboxylase delta subunit
MEKFAKSFPSKPLGAKTAKPWALAGVVGSGNLEVLMERGGKPSDAMECHVDTSIPGYKASWLAALADFAHHYPAGGTKVTINDQGAPPVLVNLRLRQAYDHLTKGDK